MSVLGAVDVGTNTTRLLVSEAGRWVARDAEITRLGAGVDRSGALAPAAVDRTLAALRRFRSMMDGHRVERFRAVCTSAVRDAANRDDFLDAATGVLGQAPEMISGDEEGRLSFRGATDGLDRSRAPFLVLDIGGGSTEVVVGSAEPEAVVSTDVGSVRLTESQLHGDPPEPEELANALAVVQAHVDDLLRAAPIVADARTVLGVAGTITTIAAVEIGLHEYDASRLHHFALTREAAEDVFRTLATERLADRVHNPGLERARADIIVGGCCVLVGIMRRLELASILVSERDILDGIVASLADARP